MGKATRKSSERKQAIDISLDQCVFMLGREQFDTFARALNDAPASNVKLRRLMSSKEAWEE
jgi:uncharacterized protein (DUF1778 family)